MLPVRDDQASTSEPRDMAIRNTPRTCFLEAEDPARFALIQGALTQRCEWLATDPGGHWSRALDNLRLDDTLTSDWKFRLAEAVASGSPIDATAVWDLAVGFCRSHQRLGPAIPDQPAFSFGHVMTRKRLADRLASVSDPTSPHTLTNRATDPAVDAIIGADLDRQRFELEDLMLSAYQMWSFYQAATPLEPYAGVDRRGPELRRRLGLGSCAPDAEFLHCSLHLGTMPRAHRPTTFDSDLNPYFRPGGQTRPLDGADDGLPEAVHEPVAGDRLAQPLRHAPK